MYCQYIDSVNNPGARFYLNVFKAKVEHFGKEGLFTSCLQEDFVTIRQRPARQDVPPLRRIGGSGEPHRGKLWSKVDQFVFVSHKSNSTFSCLLSFLDTFTATLYACASQLNMSTHGGQLCAPCVPPPSSWCRTLPDSWGK